MVFLRMAVVLGGIDSHRKVYEMIAVEKQAMAVNYRVTKWIRRITLRWYRYIQRVDEDRLLTKTFKNEI